MNDTSKKIGVLGLGSKSTVFYIMLLNKFYNNLKGGYATFPFILLNTDFNTINPHLPDQYETLETVLLPHLKQVESLGMTHLLMPNITIHKTWELLNEKHKFSFSISHPIKLMISALRSKGLHKIVLLGTLYNMTEDVLKDQFRAAGIEVMDITLDNMQFIDYVRTQVYQETNLDNTEQNKLINLIFSFAEKTPVVIACTELSVATMHVHHDNVFDMAKLQIVDTIDQYITYA